MATHNTVDTKHFTQKLHLPNYNNRNKTISGKLHCITFVPHCYKGCLRFSKCNVLFFQKY